MTPVSLSKLASETQGRLIGADCLIKGFSSDTRSVAAGDVFFCLRGDSFDGHDYAHAAIEKGASAVVCDTDLALDVPILLVADTRIAFGRFSMLWRQQFAAPVVGITGSNGKTTVKQLLASVFAKAGVVHATRANDNNDIGVPQTLLGLDVAHDYAVVEMGASAKGEIQWLGELVQPTVSVITNAGAAHLEGFGSARSVAEEKAWIYKSLPADGIAIINADDQFADYWLGVCGDRQSITFGSKGDVSAKRESNGSLSISFEDKTVSCTFQLAGEHNVANAAAASACALACGVSLEVIGQGLAAATPVSGRLNFSSFTNNITVIDDTYNANPASTRAAIDVLQDFTGTRFMALGDLLELGVDEIKEHREIGSYAQSHGVARLFAYGELSKHTVESFGEGAEWFQSQQLLIDALLKELCDSCVVLVKGSRSMRMEQVCAAVTEHLSLPQRGVSCQ